jgi:hypothetical protein
MKLSSRKDLESQLVFSSHLDYHPMPKETCGRGNTSPRGKVGQQQLDKGCHAVSVWPTPAYSLCALAVGSTGISVLELKVFRRGDE